MAPRRARGWWATSRRGASTSDPREYALSGNSVFFSANDSTHGDELWRFTLTP
ncbi:hypothetical protein [Archangium minus]|uniref:hypothetical protein n=1 Tax=Archangium minus TaxID=83450 RepID=UPI0037BF633F